MFESLLQAIIIVGGVIGLALAPAALIGLRMSQYIAAPPPRPPMPQKRSKNER